MTIIQGLGGPNRAAEWLAWDGQPVNIPAPLFILTGDAID